MSRKALQHCLQKQVASNHVDCYGNIDIVDVGVLTGEIPDETLNYIITNERLCKGEQGVRNLKRCLEIIHTKLNLFRLIKSDVKLFEKEINLGEDVVFPFVVTKKHVDILIKNEEPLNHSMLAMYV